MMKKLRTITAVVLSFATALSMAGCTSFKVIDDEEVFYDALDDAVGIEEEDTYNRENTMVGDAKVQYVIYAEDGDNYYTYIRFKREEDAMDYFDDIYDDFRDILEDNDFEGSHSMSESNSKGHIILDGILDDNTPITFYSRSICGNEDVELYGGIYVNDNVYIEVLTINGSKRDREKIDAFLKQIEFPKP